MLALLALAFVLAAALARRMVPEPYATARRRRSSASRRPRSPPSTTITPGVPAAVLLAGAALCALAVRERPRLRYVFGGALLLAGLPWLGWTFVAPGVVVAWALVVWTLRERRRLAALVAGEALAASLVFYATINDRFYGGLTPRAAGHHRRCRSSRSATSSGCRGSPACGWTATSACCAGRRCWRSCSSPAGCCTARAATSSRASRRRGARPRRARGCCSAVVGAQLAGRRAARRPAACAARRSRACRWSPRCPRVAALTAWGLRHVPRPLAALLGAVHARREHLAGPGRARAATSRAGSRSTRAPRGARRSTSSPTSPATAYWPAVLCALLAAGAAFLWWRERRAAGEWRRAAARLAHLESAALTEFVTADPATHDALREAVAVTVDALTRGARRARAALAAHDRAARGDGRARSTRARPRARRSSRCSRTCAGVLDGSLRLGDPRTVAHLHPAPLIAAAAGELAVGVDQPVDGRLRRLARGDVRRGRARALARARARARRRRLGRDDDGRDRVEPARAAAGARPGGRERAPRRPAAQRLADRRLRGQPRQHPPLGRAARARHRGRDRRRRPTRTGALSLEAFDAATAGRARDRGRRHGRARPTSARSTRSTRSPTARRARGAWFHVDAAVGSGLVSRPRQRPRLKGIERANSVTADLHKLWWQPFSASALLVPDVGVLQGRPPRQRLPQPPRGRGRGPAQPRRPLARHVAPLRRAEGPDRAARDRPPPARPR